MIWAGTALSKIAVTSILSNNLEVQVCSVPRSWVINNQVVHKQYEKACRIGMSHGK